MKAKELIEQLIKLVDEHGDMPVLYEDWDGYRPTVVSIQLDTDEIVLLPY
jgi:hypothetical protein